MEHDPKKPMEKGTSKTESEETRQLDISLFVKIGIVVLCIVVILGLGVKILPDAITVSTSSRKRDLPIYCVNTSENKVGLSFDAAWGNDIIRHMKISCFDKQDIKIY